MPTTSFCGRKRILSPPSTTATAVLFISFLLLFFQASISSQGKAVAIRILPQPVGAAAAGNTPPPEIIQAEMSKDYKKSRLASDLLNGTTKDGNFTVLDDDKRRIPSCPDPLHN